MTGAPHPPSSLSRVRRARPLAWALLAAAPLAAAGPDADGGKPDDVRTIEGKVSARSPATHDVTVETEAGSLTLLLDRNTSVFLPDRLGTVRDLVVGAPVRASFGPDRRTFWIEVSLPRGAEGHASAAGEQARSVPPIALPDPAPASPPSGVSPPPRGSDDAASSRPPASVPAGPGAPEPNPGVTRPPEPAPGPAGADPVPGSAR